MARDEEEREEAGDYRAEPSESHGAEEKRQGIGEKLARSFKEMIKARTGEARKTREADDDIGIGGEAATAEIGLDYEKTDEEADGDEDAVSAEGDGADVDEGEHGAGEGKYI